MQTDIRDRIDTPYVAADGLVVEGGASKVYNQHAFRHFLDIERLRVERSDRSFLLLLVSLRKCPALGVRVPSALGSALFSGLDLCVREVDFIGWYRDQRVAAAVLAQGADVPSADAAARIAERVTNNLRRCLPSTVAERLRVRVVRFGPRAE